MNSESSTVSAEDGDGLAGLAGLAEDVAGLAGRAEDVAGLAGRAEDVAGLAGRAEDVAGLAGRAEDVAGLAQAEDVAGLAQDGGEDGSGILEGVCSGIAGLMIGGLTINTNLDDEEPMVNYSPPSPSRPFAVAKMNLEEQDKGWQSFDEEYHANLCYAGGPILRLVSANVLLPSYLQLELAVMSICNDTFECTLIHANLLSLKGMATCSLYATYRGTVKSSM